MTSLNNGFAVIGVIAIIAVAGAGVALVMFNGDPSEQTDAANMNGVGTDGLTYEQVQAKLQHYADLLNKDDGKTHYLILSGTTHTVRSSSGSYSFSDNIRSDYMINVKVGSASVSNGDLLISGISEAYSSSSGSYSTRTEYSCDYLIPYHSIVGLKFATYVPSS